MKFKVNTELIDSNRSGHSMTNCKDKKLHKKIWAKIISSLSLSSECDSESDNVSNVSCVVSTKGSRSN